MSRTSGLENRYHVRIFDESGAQLDINNLTRDELCEFENQHETDDLDYSIRYDRMRPIKVRAHA